MGRLPGPTLGARPAWNGKRQSPPTTFNFETTPVVTEPPYHYDPGDVQMERMEQEAVGV